MSEQDALELSIYQVERDLRQIMAEAERHPDWIGDPQELVDSAADHLRRARRIAAMRAQEAVS